MDATELFKSLSTLGLGGFIFWFYRQDSEAHRIALKGYSDMLVLLVRETTTALNGLTVAIEGLRQDQRASRQKAREH
jgi:hypothetical protein